MQTDAARKLIQDTFERPFNEDQFRTFITNFLNKLEPAFFPRPQSGQFIYADYRDYISSYNRVGKYEDSEGHRLDVLIVHLAKNTTLERARSAQRTFIAKYLKEGRGGQMKDAALVAFVSPDEEDWRFSFVKMEYKIETTDKGRVRAKEEFTPAKRYSFLVGKNENSHTAQGQLLPILQDTDHNPTLKDIEDKFSVEKVTKEFFEKYRELFLEINEALDNLVKKDKTIKADFEAKGVETVDFAKKLLGQIVFLYFLQKKGWFGVDRNASWGTGPKNFLRLLYEQKLANYDNFFNDIIEPLFYEALASEREADYYSKFKCKVPFLNGGLFDPINNYDWVHTDILLPNNLFSNKEKTKQGDIGTGIIDVFDRYNFTVKEDEPLEKEVAVDPEMLGKVFENLLEVKDRKSKGTYYTPREIVHYMCQESLINYLATELDGTVSRKNIETLIKHGETALDNDVRVLETGKETAAYSFKLPDSIREHANLIDQKLADIKVCDPAVGSGAFLVGMMTEIIRARAVLIEFMRNSEDRTAYDLKRHAIQTSLYGVDIDPGAVEIAKLRLWLSMIVDEDDYRQIKPLPNLDYKVMQGNSLLEEYEGIKLIDERFFAKTEDKEAIQKCLKESQSELQKDYFTLHTSRKLTPVKKLEIEKRLKEIERQLNSLDKPSGDSQDSFSIFGKTDIQAKAEKLLKLHEAFFAAYHKREKDKLKEEIDRLTWDLIETSLRQQRNSDKLKEVGKLQQINVRPFFLWRLNFAEIFQHKGGFDVVIANPPYGANIDEMIGVYKRIYPNTTKAYRDIYKIFIELGLGYLVNEGGILCFILPNTLLLQPRYNDARSYLLRNTIVSIVNLGEEVFEQVVVPTCIIIIKRGYTGNKSVHYADVSISSKFNGDMNMLQFLDIPQTIYESSPGNLLIANVRQTAEDEVILRDVLEMKDCGIKYQRTNIGLSNKGGSDLAERLFYEGKKQQSSDHPFIIGKDLHKEGWYVDIRPKRFMRHNFKNLLKANEIVYFSEQFFNKKEKLVWRQTSQYFVGTYLSSSIWFANTLQGGILKAEYIDKFDLKYILALLNSSYLRHLYTNIVRETGRVFPQVKLSKLELLPIKKIPLSEQQKFIKIVDNILALIQGIDYLNDNVIGGRKVYQI